MNLKVQTLNTPFQVFSSLGCKKQRSYSSSKIVPYYPPQENTGFQYLKNQRQSRNSDQLIKFCMVQSINLVVCEAPEVSSYL